jgi:hypothetical protein
MEVAMHLLKALMRSRSTRPTAIASRTSKAINYFGNAGCSYDNEGDIPLSHADRSTILAIKKTEQSLGCL